ncbi:nucleotidyl transferase AbiEii/AbiGii toxin family protein [Lachnospiraceae bacterium 47-T17]
MNYNKGQLGQMAKRYGFVRDTFEKVLRLKEILIYLNTDEYLHEHLALKGGTAINMTIFNLPRLSVDLDLDFTPNLPLGDMEKAREKITKMLENYMTEEGYFLSGSSRYSHSLDSMLFQYQNAGGNRDNIKLELNYSLRSHIFAPVERKVVTDIFEEDVIVRTLEPIEIFAAKANALMSRAAARDLYDFNNMIYFGLFDGLEYELLRKCIIFYASISADKINKTFNTSAIDGLEFSKIRRDLFPVLRKKDNFNLDERKKEAKKFIKELMVLTPEEKEYLELFETGEYRPELLFEDDEIIQNIGEHPMAIWKMKNEYGTKMVF